MTDVFDSETPFERYHRRRDEFVKHVSHAVNYSGLDTDANTRDYLVAEYLWSCLQAFILVQQNQKNAEAGFPAQSPIEGER